jgi:hypothetical protein
MSEEHWDYQVHKCDLSGISISTQYGFCEIIIFLISLPRKKICVPDSSNNHVAIFPAEQVIDRGDHNQYAPNFNGDTIGVRQDVNNNNQNHNNLNFKGNNNVIYIYNNNYNLDCMTCSIM